MLVVLRINAKFMKYMKIHFMHLVTGSATGAGAGAGAGAGSGAGAAGAGGGVKGPGLAGAVL